jgi:hypothetical protein
MLLDHLIQNIPDQVVKIHHHGLCSDLFFVPKKIFLFSVIMIFIQIIVMIHTEQAMVKALLLYNSNRKQCIRHHIDHIQVAHLHQILRNIMVLNNELNHTSIISGHRTLSFKCVYVYHILSLFCFLCISKKQNGKRPLLCTEFFILYLTRIFCLSLYIR